MCGKLISAVERVSFTRLLGALNLGESFSSSNPVKFSWDNKWRDGVRILARLDRIYSFLPTGVHACPMVEYFIRGDSNHSDHLPVWGKLELKVTPPRKSSYKMSARFREEVEVRNRITLI